MRRDFILGSLLTLGLLMSGCGDNDTEIETTSSNEPVLLSYKITVSNLTYGQPMSPIVVAYHDMGTAIYKVGEKATVGLEKLAEGGDNSAFLSELSKQSFIAEYQSGTKLIKPSEKDTVIIESQKAECISVASMFVNTNDGFVGINCVNVSQMKVNDKKVAYLTTYDAGTEANTETKETVAGLEGEGFNSNRDDKDFISVHAGVITKDDGLLTSGLTQSHKWDNPSAFILIERIK